MNPFWTNVTMLILSGLMSLFAFLFAAWIRGQMNEKVLALENKMLLLEISLRKDLVGTNDLAEVKAMLQAMTRQLTALQRIVDRRFGDMTEED